MTITHIGAENVFWVWINYNIHHDLNVHGKDAPLTKQSELDIERKTNLHHPVVVHLDHGKLLQINESLFRQLHQIQHPAVLLGHIATNRDSNGISLIVIKFGVMPLGRRSELHKFTLGQPFVG